MKILVIGDDPDITELLQVALEPSFHEVITANSGPEGIYLARQQSPDMIILDMMMPQTSGPEICRVLRKFNKSPILILSALDSPGIIIAALEAGADDYLIKPVTNGMLIAHINKFLRRSVIPRPISIPV